MQFEGKPSKTTTVAPDSKMLTPEQVSEATELLKKSAMFHACTEAQRRAVASKMERCEYKMNQNITEQDDPVNRFWVMAAGDTRRLRTKVNGAHHHLNNIRSDNAISSLGIIEQAKTYATVTCMSNSGCIAYTMHRSDLLSLLHKDAALQQGVIESLSARLRHKMDRRTPLLEQKGKSINHYAVSIAAALESYPQSALNSVLNQKLTGVSSSLLPKMHLQIPLRIMYINGVKGIRGEIEKHFEIDGYSDPRTRIAARVGAAIAPGLLMAPIGSLLEACNAGHSNRAPLLQRSSRGTLPRMMREMIFTVGLNQMSDYFEERWRSVIANYDLARASGSITAGIVSGYLSHVPHCISALRILNPTWTYKKVFQAFVDKSAPAQLIPSSIPIIAHMPLRMVLACLIPRGVVVRITKICVSFVVFNSTVEVVERDQARRLKDLAKMEEEDW